MQQLHLVLTVLAALGSSLMVGTFFAFSVFVMDALARLPAGQGIAAMKSINVTVLNPIFLGVFLGTALICAGLGIVTLASWSTSGSTWLVLGCLLYVVGCFGVTMIFNVPLNNALARVTDGTSEASAFWATYQSQWTTWNHVRTVAPLAALACFIQALR
jgi:uncharacterized membrane protein